jgi:hypothetical protein
MAGTTGIIWYRRRYQGGALLLVAGRKINKAWQVRFMSF